LSLVPRCILLTVCRKGVIAPISSGFYVSTDDIFDDSKWSNAVYLEDIGFDQDVSAVSLQTFAKDSSSSTTMERYTKP
jgi:hypothetical protein